MNVISVGLDKNEISSPIKTFRLGDAAITPSESFSGDFKPGDYKHGLITSIRNEL